jgi:hypothetical protein
MPERGRLEDSLKQVQSDLDEASKSFEASVDALGALVGSKDTARINAAKDAMQLWSDAVRTLSERERALQRRLTHATTIELSRSASKAVRSASRAAWAAFWVTAFAMIGWTVAFFIATGLDPRDLLQSGR